MQRGKIGPGFECTPWSKPGVLRSYKYKGYTIEYIEQSCFNHYSVYHHHEFRALKDGNIVTKGHRRYSDCVNEIKKIIARNEKGFYFAGEEVSWEEIPLSVRKHDYPYYFDKDGNDCFPIINDEELKK